MITEAKRLALALATIAGFGAFCVAVPFPSAADPLDDRFAAQVPDAVADQALLLALERVHLGKCEDQTSCAKATDAERANPPITTADARAAMVFAIKSALASWCGLDYRRSFLPMMIAGREKMKLSERQLRLMALIHGDFMARQIRDYKNSGQTCPNSFKAQLDGYLPKL